MSDKDILKDALDKFTESDEASHECRADAEDDTRFARLGDQWDDQVAEIRRKEGRPCLTINRLPGFLHQVENDARQNKPGIGVHPVDNGADESTAQVIGGLVRSIERQSRADQAYDTAISHAITGGFGFFRISTDYCHPMSFDMDLRIERIANPFSVHWDTNSTGFDASDWNYAFVSEWLTEDEFEQKYPGKDKTSFSGDTQDAQQLWTLGDQIRVAEYWEKTEEKKKLIMLNDGRTMLEHELVDLAKDILGMMMIDLGNASDEEWISTFMMVTGVTQTRERDTSVSKVIRRMLSADEVLEEEEVWHGSTIPICPVWGEEVFLDGKRHLRSLIRDAKDPQRMFNYWRSASTELVALAPKAPFVVERGAIPEDERDKWETANSRSYAYLEYTKGYNIPQRQPFAGVPAGIIQESLQSSDDMKSTVGIYDAALGARSNETSGIAIRTRQRESDVSNFHFIDNLNRSIQYAGKILVECIPHIYSARQTIRILGEDDAEKVITLTQETQKAMYAAQYQENGMDEDVEDENRLYDIAVGKYDVTVSSGPSYQTQREETREWLIEIMRQVPGAAQVLGDLVLDVMDFPNADKIAKRLKHILPPEIQAAEGMTPQMPMPGAAGMPGGVPPGAPPNPNMQPQPNPAQMAGFFNGAGK